MCLSKIIKTYEPNDNIVVAYKKFYGEYGWLYSPYQNINCRTGKYYQANNRQININRSISYESGFHAFIDKNEALSTSFGYDIYEVHLWDIRVEGIQNKRKVIVAKNMRIIRKIET